MTGSTSSRAATFLSQLTTPFRGLRSIVERWLFQFGNPLTAFDRLALIDHQPRAIDDAV